MSSAFISTFSLLHSDFVVQHQVQQLFEPRRLNDFGFAVRLGDAGAFERGLASILNALNAEPHGRAANAPSVSSRPGGGHVPIAPLLNRYSRAWVCCSGATAERAGT
jgi:hypothetical protein